MKLSIHIKTKPPKEKIDNSFEEFGVFGCCLFLSTPILLPLST